MEDTRFQKAVDEFIEKRIDDNLSDLNDSKLKLALKHMESELQKAVTCEQNRETLREIILQVVDRHALQAYRLGWADSRQLSEDCLIKK